MCRGSGWAEPSLSGSQGIISLLSLSLHFHWLRYPEYLSSHTVGFSLLQVILLSCVTFSLLMVLFQTVFEKVVVDRGILRRCRM